MAEPTAYLLVGDDESSKQKKINAIKEAVIDPAFKDIDFEIIYADNKELDPPRFNEALSYLPASKQKKRLIVIRRLKSLTQDNRALLIRYLKSPSPETILVLDAAAMGPEDAFLKELRPFASTTLFQAKRKLDTFDLIRAIGAHNTKKALQILHALLSNREKPENIIGGLTWHWENAKDSLGLEKFRQAVTLLLATDVRIKSGRAIERIALDTLVIRLSSLT